MSNNLMIGSKEFHIAKPVFIILDTLKNETGIDFALGMDPDKTKGIMADMKLLAKVISLITTNECDEEYDEEKVRIREDYFYRNAEMNDFVKALGFFSHQLRLKETDTIEPSKVAKAQKGKMKLVKTN